MIKGKAEIAFGTGDIRTTTMLYENRGILVLDNQAAHEIGEALPISTDFTIKGKEIMITFSRVESIDVVIADLLEVKRLMTEGKHEGDMELFTTPSDFWKDDTNDTLIYPEGIQN